MMHFSCKLLTSNNAISHAIWSTQAQILEATIFSYLLTPNCTQNHVVSYTN